ncbi:hypothetical protein NDU88_007312 [Pleurodeles waltl]|uniref:Uncharacterized protein n=1 Tax=Pleurodeles waltl TaxID=8319 RepID=A0AAV7RUP2_PLEWA|nr:hypothetical protein NDU88_007312 [Pleurodeles waltl]
MSVNYHLFFPPFYILPRTSRLPPPASLSQRRPVHCGTVPARATLSLERGRGVGFSAFLVLRSWGREDPAGVISCGLLPVAASTGVVRYPEGILPVVVFLLYFGALLLFCLIRTPESVPAGTMEPRVLRKLSRIGHTR